MSNNFNNKKNYFLHYPQIKKASLWRSQVINKETPSYAWKGTFPGLFFHLMTLSRFPGDSKACLSTALAGCGPSSVPKPFRFQPPLLILNQKWQKVKFCNGWNWSTSTLVISPSPCCWPLTRCLPLCWVRCLSDPSSSWFNSLTQQKIDSVKECQVFCWLVS